MIVLNNMIIFLSSNSNYSIYILMNNYTCLTVLLTSVSLVLIEIINLMLKVYDLKVKNLNDRSIKFFHLLK